MPPNVIWVTLDSIRIDHTSMGGYRRDTTPNLQRICRSEDGGWFPHCIAHGNSTRISTASITTGTNPSHHGVYGNRVIPDELKTGPERFQESGYQTICISRNANASMGFNRGFDVFDWFSASNIFQVVPIRTLLKYSLNLRRHSAGFTLNTAKHATPFIINDMVKRRLNGMTPNDQPYFLYLHYNEPHRPYVPPLPYLDRYTEDINMSAQKAADFAVYVHENMSKLIAEGCPFSEDEWAALEAMYDAEIAYTDMCIGRLFDHVQSLEGDTIFIVTADHGELFGEKGLLSHKILLHDSLINVPLVVHGFDEIMHQTNELVQHADLMETLVRHAGGEPTGMHGVDLRSETREFTISQEPNVEVTISQFREHNPDFDSSVFHVPFSTALRTKEFKYQKSDAGSDIYRLPDEDTDVSQKYPEVTSELDEMLERWWQDEGQLVGKKEGEFSAAMQAQLEDLGYMM